jgi:hypothetical protein
MTKTAEGEKVSAAEKRKCRVCGKVSERRK